MRLRFYNPSREYDISNIVEHEYILTLRKFQLPAS